MIIIDLLHNVSILITLSVLSGFINFRFNKTKLRSKFLQGILFGVTAVIGMLNPFVLADGIIFDGRSIIISLCTLFFGPVSGVIAAAITVAHRFSIGGAGALMGTLVITASFLIGLLFYNLRKNSSNKEFTLIKLYLFGIIVHIAMLILILLLPSKNILDAYKIITLTVIGVFPVVTVIIGKVLLELEEKQNFIIKIGESEKRYRNFFEKNIAGTYLSTVEGKLIDCNFAFARMLGYNSIEEVLNINTAKLYPESAYRIDFLNKLRENKTLTNIEIVLIKKDGTEIICIENVVGNFEDNGTLLQFQGYIIDITERKQTEIELEKINTHYQKLIENAPDGIALISPEGKFKFVSSSARKMFGYLHEEAIDQNPDDLTHPEDLPKVYAALSELITNPSYVPKIEYRFKHKNGNWIWIESTFTNLLSEPSIKAIVINFREITESKLAREELKVSEELYRTLIDTSPDAITVTDKDGNITFISHQALELYGQSSTSEVIGHNVLEWVAAENHHKAIAAIQSLFNSVKQTRDELLLKRKDKSLFWAEVNAAAIFDSHGSVKGLIIIARDITERKQTEKVLQESEENYRHIFNGMNDMVFVIDMNGKFIDVNKSAIEKLAYTKEEFLLLGPADIDHTLGKDKIVNLIKNIPLDKVQYFETNHMTKAGDIIPVEIKSTLIPYKGNHVILSIASDISERKQTEEKMKFSEERYKTLFESSPVGVLLVDDKGIILEANKSYCKVMGYLKNELVGNNIKIIVAPENHSIVENNIRELLSGKVLEHNVESINKDGKIISVQLSETRITLPDNRTGILSISTDVTERKQFEQALKESESSYRGLFNSVSEAIYILDESGSFIDVNDGALKMYGFEKEELIGKTPEFVSVEGKNDLTKTAELLGKAFSGENQKLEFWGKRKNGSAFLKDIRLYPGKYFNKPVVIALAQDITGRKRLETIQKIQYNIAEAVVSSKNLNALFEMVRIELSNIINVKNFFIALYDENTGMLRSDVDEDEIEKISEWSAKNSMTGYVIETRKSLLLTKSEINSMMETGVANMVGIIPEVWLGVPFKVSGKVVGVLVVQSYTNAHEYDNSTRELLDIVAHELSIFIHHKHAEEQTLKLSTAVSQSPATIVITDLKGNIEYVNPKFSSLTGYSFEEVKGQNPRILNSGIKTKEEYKDMWKTILSGKEWRGEFYNKKKDGELFWESATISPIINQNGEITNFIAVKEDITAQKKMTEELIAAKEKAEEMNRIKSYFYANMSHELRTPFVGILGYSELLSESLLDEDQRYMANQILSSSRRLTDTLNKVLDVTKLEFDKIEKVIADTDIFQMITKLQNLFNISAKQKNTVIKTHFVCEPFIFSTDENLLREVLTNLVNNAIKFTTNGTITISVEKVIIEKNYQVVIRVADTGVGIPKEKQDIIWDEFRQASEGLNRSFEGTGLGLTIVKKYTGLLGGKITVESEPGKGSIFTIELPVVFDLHEKVQEPQNVIIVDKTTSTAQIEYRPKVLYVEDDPVAVQFVDYVLQKYYDVSTVTNASNVLKMVSERQYDLLLIDINLGYGMDGVELTQLIRQIPSYYNTPVIAVTAYASNNDKEEFLSKGFSHYLSKPFTINELKEIINLSLKSAV